MTDLAVLGFLFLFLCFLLLLVRFVLPELIYIIRQILAKIEINRLILEEDSAEEGADPDPDRPNKFQRALIADIRYESPFAGDEYVMNRLKKISVLYRILVREQRANNGVNDINASPHVCIIELANLLDNLGRKLVPRTEFDNPVSHSREILRFLMEEVRRKSNPGEGDQEPDEDVPIEAWYTENPMSIEQCIELLSAAAWALAYREISSYPVAR